MTSSTRVGGRFAIRPCFINPRSTLADADALAQALATAAAAQATADERARALGEASERNRELLEQQERDAKVVAELTPIKAVLEQMTRKVNEMENQQKEQHGLITQQLTDSRKAGDELRATTDALSQALRSNNVKGKWGEAQLRRIVEVSGLLNYVDFYTQESSSTDAGGIRPDMVIRLPGGRTIIIDANEGWTADEYAALAPALLRLGVEMVDDNEPDPAVHIAEPANVPEVRGDDLGDGGGRRERVGRGGREVLVGHGGHSPCVEVGEGKWRSR